MIAEFIRQEVEAGLRAALRPLPHYLRLLLAGVGLVSLSLVAYLFALLFGSVGVFFTILEQSPYAEAAFWVGGGWLLLAALLTYFGSSRIREPRGYAD